MGPAPGRPRRGAPAGDPRARGGRACRRGCPTPASRRPRCPARSSTPGASTRARGGASCSRTSRVQTLEAFGCEDRPLATAAAAAVLRYVRETQRRDLAHVTGLRTRHAADGLAIDAGTRRNLELVETLADGSRRGTLLGVLDETRTAMGARAMRDWILRPLTSLERIQDRLDAVEELGFRTIERGRLREALGGVQDLDRIIGRVTLGTAGPRDLAALAQSLRALPAAAACLAECVAPLVRGELKDVDPPLDVAEAIERVIVDDPPATLRDGGADPRRRRRRAGRAARGEPRRADDHRRHRGARARADRHRVPQGPLQPRLRVLHRGQQIEPRAHPRRLRPQADDRGRRALRHPRAEGVRGPDPPRRRAHPRQGGGDLRRPARPRGRRGPARPADRPRGRGHRRAGLAGRGVVPLQLRQAADDRRRRARLRRRPPSRGGAAARRPVRRQRPPHGRRRGAACRSSPAPTWAASPPSCGRPRSSS